MFYITKIFDVGNESAWLLISLMQCKLNPGQDTVCKLISIQLSNASGYGNITLASMLQLIAKVNSICVFFCCFFFRSNKVYV